MLTDLNPYFVMSHFLLAITVLGLASIAWARATLPQDGFVAGRRLSLWTIGTALLGLGLIVSGAFSTASGPHSGAPTSAGWGTCSTRRTCTYASRPGS